MGIFTGERGPTSQKFEDRGLRIVKLFWNWRVVAHMGENFVHFAVTLTVFSKIKSDTLSEICYFLRKRLELQQNEQNFRPVGPQLANFRLAWLFATLNPQIFGMRAPPFLLKIPILRRHSGKSCCKDFKLVSFFSFFEDLSNDVSFNIASYLRFLT